EVDEELLAASVGLHRHRARPPAAAQHLPAQPVELLERIKAKHGHGTASLALVGCPVAVSGCGQAAGLAITSSTQRTRAGGGTPPTCRGTSGPWRRASRVGMPRASKRSATRGASSMLILTAFR